ncbi:MAG TPA: hypothetical protein VIV60_29500 [Polyangiaceae bacterium]
MSHRANEPSRRRGYSSASELAVIERRSRSSLDSIGHRQTHSKTMRACKGWLRPALRVFVAALCIGRAALAQSSPEPTTALDAGLPTKTVATTPDRQDDSAARDGEIPTRADSNDEYMSRFWLVDPRLRPTKPALDIMRFEVHGEYQASYARFSDVPLSSYGFDDYGSRLGQSYRLSHRMRFTPRFTYRKTLSVVGQFDVPFGLLLGNATDHVSPDPEPMHEAQPMRARFRWLYAEIDFGGGQVRVGQQPAHWGTGLIYNSGDERTTFGESRYGTIVERVSYRGKPFGSTSAFEMFVATDWVYSDTRVQWLNGDHALRATLALSLTDRPERRVGLLVVGEKLQPHVESSLRQKRPTETSCTFDLSAEANAPVPGLPAYIVSSMEGAAIFGRTDVSTDTSASTPARIQRLGAVARIGAVGTRGKGKLRWGRWGLMLEWGFASNDSDPTDGVDRRFVANPANRVGLVLFDEVLRWKSARAATALMDSRLGQRNSLSAFTVPTGGGVTGATYLSLQWLFRPLPNFDWRASALVAQTTGDVVDPATLVTQGKWQNYEGGNPIHRDLGFEGDLATEYRHPLANGLGLSLGAEGGLLLPGRALASAAERTIGVQGLVRARFGFYF